jgi:ATP-dependent Clp protease ATP-binding subunit ClpC
MNNNPEKEISQKEQDVLTQIPFIAATADHPHDIGVEIDGVFYHWNVRLDALSRRIEKLARSLEKAVSALIVAAAALSMIWFLVNALLFLPQGTFFKSSFWLTNSIHQFWLWVSLGLILLFIYRHAIATREPREGGDYIKHEIKPQQATWDTVKSFDRVHRVMLSQRLSKDGWSTLDDASMFATKANHEMIGLLHLFAGTLSQARVGHIFARLGLTFDSVKDALVRKMQERPQSTGGRAESLDPEAQKTLMGAVAHSLIHGRTVISSVDIFVSAYRNSPFIQELFYGAGIENEAMENVLSWLQIREQLRARWESFRKASILKPTSNMNRAMTAVATPILDRMSHDLTAQAARGQIEMLIGREEEVERILRVFEGGGRSVVLVGPSGVGKQAIVSGIAELMVKEKVPKMLQDRRLVSLDVGRIVAGATASQAEERLLRALNEVAHSRNIALVIPNIDDMVGITSGSAQSLDLSSLLATELEKGYVVAIATATTQAYISSIEGTSLGSALTKISIDEPNKSEAIQVVAGKVGKQEGQHQVIFSYASVEAAVDLTGRFIHDQHLPEKALRVLDEVALYAKQQRGIGASVTREDVAHVISKMSNIPLTAVSQDEKQKLLNLEDEMHNRMVGQNEAVEMVASALRRARAEMRSGGRPIANFMFMGPTGVGKTELAKTIAESYFGDEEAMIRLDMSEYQDDSSINRLIGVPGSGMGGVFTEAVRKRPFGLILLDELEKANKDILNVFLQVFDDGRLTDATGRTIDFTQTIIVATSNVGAQYIQDEIRKQTPIDHIKTYLIEEELSKVYRPEFLNRFDGIIVFTPLSANDVMAIARLMLKSVIARMDEKGIVFEVTDAAIREVATAGYDPQFGARPLRRVIQDRVEDPLATILLEGSAERRDTIVLDAGGHMEVRKAAEL